MTIPIDQKITALENKLSELDGRLVPVEAQIAALPDKLTKLENQAEAVCQRVCPLEQHKANLDTTISTLSSAVIALQIPSPEKPVSKFFAWANRWAEPLGKVVIPCLVLIVAWWVKDSVDHALKAREIEVSTAQAMRDQ